MYADINGLFCFTELLHAPQTLFKRKDIKKLVVESGLSVIEHEEFIICPILHVTVFVYEDSEGPEWMSISNREQMNIYESLLSSVVMFLGLYFTQFPFPISDSKILDKPDLDKENSFVFRRRDSLIYFLSTIKEDERSMTMYITFPEWLEARA